MENVTLFYSYLWSDPIRNFLFIFCSLFTFFVVHIGNISRPLLMRIRNQLLFPSFGLLLLFFNPFSVGLLTSSRLETSRVFRFSWIIPLLPITALVLVSIIRKLSFPIVKFLLSLLIPTVFVCLNFNFSFFNHYWTNETPNLYKIPECVIDLCDYIEDDKTFARKTVVMPYLLSAWVHQYRSDIIMPYAANHHESSDVISGSTDLFQYVNGSDDFPYDLSEIGRIASEYPFNYIVIPSYASTSGSLEEYGYHLVYRVNAPPLTLYEDEGKDYTLFGAYHTEYYLYRRKDNS